MQRKIERWLANSTKTIKLPEWPAQWNVFFFSWLSLAFNTINMRAKLCETQTSWYASVPFAKGFNTQINKGHCLCFESSLKVFSHSCLKQCCSYLKAVTLNSWVSGFSVETELMHLINNNVSPGTVASSLMKCIKEREHYCFQHSLHHHAKIFKWWKHWMIFFFFLQHF